jgi:hypothetical protein
MIVRAQILTLNADCSTEEICKHIAHAMEEFNDECFITVVKKETSIFYCATITNKKVNAIDAEIIYRAMDISRLYERELDFLEEESKEHLEVIYEEIQRYVAFKKIYKLPKVTLLMEELIDTYVN